MSEDQKTTESKSGPKEKSGQSKADRKGPPEDEMKRVFEQFDANKDGVISSDELSRFMDHLGFAHSEEDVQALVKAVDDDCNGTVDFNEFYSLYASITGGDEKVHMDKKTEEEVN
jgi:Ca2+-binding EF-hand superfamily protein